MKVFFQQHTILSLVTFWYIEFLIIYIGLFIQLLELMGSFFLLFLVTHTVYVSILIQIVECPYRSETTFGCYLVVAIKQSKYTINHENRYRVEKEICYFFFYNSTAVEVFFLELLMPIFVLLSPLL